ncbi:hypothetical protein [Shimia abyssi]|nr:hypothetical protein [Shimia abyssi]
MHNSNCLRRNLQVFTRKHMIELCEAARAYSVSREMSDLLAFSAEFAALVEQIDPTERRPVIISSEDLSGCMPGRRGLTDYRAAPILMKAMSETAARAFNAEYKLTYYFSTRQSDEWLRSCYAQHLRATRMSATLSEYCEKYRSSADLDRIVDGVRLAVGASSVVATPLESLSKRRLGPLGGLFDALEVPSKIRSRVKALPPSNVSLPQELLDEFLLANRSDLDDDTVKKAKFEARQIWLTGSP